MNRNYIKLNAIIISLLVALIMNTGFVTWAVANPVSLYTEENSGIYKVSVVLDEAAQINAFQLKIEYNRQYLRLQDAYFDEEFELLYNSRNNGLLKCSNKGETDGYIRFLGVQTDDMAASQETGTVIGIIEFTTDLTDVAEIAKALDTVVLTVEVIQSDNGNIAPDDGSWRVKASLNNDNNYEKESVEEEDLKEDIGSYGNNDNSTSVEGNTLTNNGLNNSDSVTKVTNEGVSADITKTEPEITTKVTTKAASDIREKEDMADVSTKAGVVSDVVADSQNKQHEVEKNQSEDNRGGRLSSKEERENGERNEFLVIRFVIQTIVIFAIIMFIRKYKEKKERK